MVFSCPCGIGVEKNISGHLRLLGSCHPRLAGQVVQVQPPIILCDPSLISFSDLDLVTHPVFCVVHYYLSREYTLNERAKLSEDILGVSSRGK